MWSTPSPSWTWSRPGENGSTVAADGTQVDTYIDNLLAETSIRYGGFGGIAYHYISDTYVALFSRFIPCRVWEAVHLIEGLLANTSDIQPSTVHADTQGQNFPVFALATLFGFDLMPRFGAYATDDLHRQPDPFDPLLKEVDFTEVDLAA
jgi:TnpA family transposase